MKKFEKMLMAIYEPDFKCHGPKGSWLYLASKKDTKKGLFRIPRQHYYFVSLNEQRLPSEIGVVKRLAEPITAWELAQKDYESRKLDISTLNDETLTEYAWFLEKVNAQPEHMPMAVTWLERPISNTKELRLHKNFSPVLQKKRK